MSEATQWGFPNTATPSGSAAYYVVRFSAAQRRDTLARWLAWFEHLDGIARKAKDPGVARLKLDWWREEAERMLAGQGRHPLAGAIGPLLHSEAQVGQMRRALDAIEQRILRRQPQTLAEFQRQCTDHMASRLHLLCDTCVDLPNAVEHMGLYIAATERLANLASDLRDHYLSLPRQSLHEHQLSASQLEQPTQPPALQTLGDSLLSACQAPIPNAQDSNLGPARRYFAQSQRLARQVQKNAYASNQLHRISPLGLLWSAWRERD